MRARFGEKPPTTLLKVTDLLAERLDKATQAVVSLRAVVKRQARELEALRIKLLETERVANAAVQRANGLNLQDAQAQLASRGLR